VVAWFEHDPEVVAGRLGRDGKAFGLWTLFGSANLASTKRVSGRVARLTPSPPDGRASGFGKGGGRSSVIGRRLYRIPRTDDRQHFADLDGSGPRFRFHSTGGAPLWLIENNKTQRIRVNKQIRISPSG